jgi:hypothetical protein
MSMKAHELKTTKGDNMAQHIIIDGNPVDGYQFYGPFDSKDEACTYADENLDYGREWCIAKLVNPKGE